MEEYMKTKKVDKLKILLIAILGTLAMGVASAGIVQYFGQRTTTINVELPIDITGDTTNELYGMGCGQVTGSELGIVNKAGLELNVNITSTEVNGLGTSYIGRLQLVTKQVDFTSEVWNIIDGNTAEVEYTIVGDKFTAEVISGDKPGYVLVYYKDNDERFTDPAEAILTTNITGNLPYDTDRNKDGYDYCLTGEYDTCHGAKIWYVPLTAINPDNSLNWGRANEFLYESELIQYNAAGVVTMYPDSTLTIYPQFDLECMLNGTVIVTTTVDIAE